MAQDIRDTQQTLQNTDCRVGDSLRDASATHPSLSHSVSFSRLNARAPEFVPRAAAAAAADHGPNRVKFHHHPHHHHPHHHQQPVVGVLYHNTPSAPPPPVSPQFVIPAASHGMYPHHEYFRGEIGEHEPDVDQVSAPPPARDGLSEDVIQKITKQGMRVLEEE